MSDDVNPADLEPLAKLNKDLKSGARSLGDQEARYLVDTYYTMQEYRKAAHNQRRALDASGEPNDVLEFFGDQFARLEGQVKLALDLYSRNHPRAEWLRSVPGIGPVIAAGLLAHIDLTHVRSVGQVWSFAGLNPSVEWLGREKAKTLVAEVKKQHPGKSPSIEALAEIQTRTGRSPRSVDQMATAGGAKATWTNLEKGLAKPPYSKSLKTLCWKIGQSFMKLHNNERDFYGKLYVQRKMYEIERNNSGANSQYALERAPRFGKTTEAFAWLSGERDGMPKIPPGQIDARARRWAVKLFLSHLLDSFFAAEGKELPVPFAIAHLDHSDFIPRPEFKSDEDQGEAAA